ncbi:MAG TPA: ABC transporter transmembrane domain-containing protein, partial [Anaerolineales bacterium]|nr:ABC transporter transmembrane domain-containing protein [Anaerolineales bacterium]
MLKNAAAPAQLKREFSVADEHIYNRSGPVRWILSHLVRYPHFLASFLLAATLTNLLFSAIPLLIGRAFDEVLQPEPDPQRLLTTALTILGLVLVRGLLDITNSWSVETLGQRMERDAREELFISLLGKSQTFHNRQRVGDIMARATNDVRQLNPMMNPGVSLIIESVIGTIAPLVFIALLLPQLLLSPLLFVVTFIIALRRYINQLNPVAGEQ